MATSARRRDQRGIVLPSPVTFLSMVAVTVAGIAWFVTRHPEPTEERVTPPASHATHTPSASPSTYVTPKPHHLKPQKPAFDRTKYPVAVFNNSTIHGLAARVASQTSHLGWQVVGADNWYGTIPTTTVYYPPQLAKAGHQLALDLGIHRTMPSVAPMRLDRLTLILTGPLPLPG